MRAAICLFNDGDPTRTDVSNYIVDFKNKFSDWCIDVFEYYSNPSLEKNLMAVKWEKRKSEVKENFQYNVNIGLNIVNPGRLLAINDLEVAEQTLYFTDGYGDDFKTVINLTCFYGNSLVFDRAAEFCQYKFSPALNLIEERKFHWYIKTWKMSTLCIDKENFKIK